MNGDTSSIRLNVVNLDDQSYKISIIIPSKTSVIKLKRIIQQQFWEIYEKSLLISTIQDCNGFILSNNSEVCDHVRPNDTMYIRTQDKQNKKMSLSNDVSDICLTLRYVSKNVLERMLSLELQNLDLSVIMTEVVHLCFWYSNSQVVEKTLQFMNKLIMNQDKVVWLYESSGDQNRSLIMKLLVFWLIEVNNSFIIYPEIYRQVLELLSKLIENQPYCKLIKESPIAKNLVILSKNQAFPLQFKKITLQIIKILNGQKGTGIKDNTKSSYLPTIFTNIANEAEDLESVLEMLKSSNNQQFSALQLLADEQSSLISQACVRFDYYYRLMNVFTIKNIRAKTQVQQFNQVISSIIKNTSKQKSVQIMQKDIMNKIHSFLQQSPIQTHAIVLQYLQKISQDSTSASVFNIQSSSQFIFSPYLKMQKIITHSLSEMSQADKKVSRIRFIPCLKDVIRLSLKSDDKSVIKDCLKIVSNLCLQEQCRYQIINLKGIELFVRYLQSSKDIPIQRVCAKGLLNLSVSSREMKVKVIAAMNNVIEKYYKLQYDTITQGFIDTLLKSSNH